MIRPSLLLAGLLLATSCTPATTPERGHGADATPEGRLVLAHAVYFRGIFYSEDRAARLAADADHVIDDGRVPTSAPNVRVDEFPALVRNMQIEISWLERAGIDALTFDMHIRPGMTVENADPEMSSAAVLAARHFDLPMPFGGRFGKSMSTYLIFSAWLEAARASGARQRFAPQVDLALYTPGESPLPIAHQVARLLRDWKDHPNFLRRDGRPVVATWAGSLFTPAQWREVIATVDTLVGERVFWLQEFRPYHLYRTVGGPDPSTWAGLDPAWREACDGLYQWEVATAPRQAAQTQDGLDALARSWGKLTTWSMSPGFWHGQQVWGKTKNNRNDTRLRVESLRAWDERWRDGLRHGADWAVINTWNDESENHQIFPTRLKSDAYLRMTSYYARWWKEGREPADFPDTVVVLYPAAVNNPPGPAVDVGGGEPEVAEVWSCLAAPATLVVENTSERIALAPGRQVLALGRCRPGPFAIRLEPAAGPARAATGAPVRDQAGQPHQNWFRRALVLADG